RRRALCPSRSKNGFSQRPSSPFQSNVLPTMVGPSKSRPPMSHRNSDLGIPAREKSAKVVLMSCPAANGMTRPRLRSAATIEPASATFAGGRFGSRPAERPFYNFDGIDCRPELDAKTVDRLIHRRRQFPPPVDSAAHRFFDGRYHLLDRHVAVSLRHGSVASLFGGAAAASKRDMAHRAALTGRPCSGFSDRRP